MENILLAALLACTQNSAVCNEISYEGFTELRVCDVSPTQAGARPIELFAQVHDEVYKIVLEPKCTSV